jgi:putative ABC transport system permease protein
MARRDALRARGRSILVLVMIALPVLAVTAADIAIATQDIQGGEALERRLGASDAYVTSVGSDSVQQDFDPDDGYGWSGKVRPADHSLADLHRVLGDDVRALEIRRGSVSFATTKGIGDAEVTEVDLRDPLAQGFFDLTAGRLPAGPHEVVVNADLAARGPGIGDRLELGNGTVAQIVGLAESTSYRGHSIAAGPVGAFGLGGPDATYGEGPAWLVDAGGPVSWEDVRALNEAGMIVASRSVITDPPPPSEASPDMMSGGDNSAMVAVIALIAVMALIEVVLLAGPAFAVTARRQARTLALISASGGTPPQARRVILATGLVLGTVAAVLGVVLGIVSAWALMPVLQHYSNSMFGPFDVPWLHLAGIAGFGLVSALLAAVVPAFLASRQDVVAVLAGRRGDRVPSLRSPLLGLLLLGAGVAASAYGAKAASNGEFLIAGAAIVVVLGMILLVPVVVVLVARLARRLPLVVRYAVRDASRHRTRTVPAVAAVAASVAGVVALGIGMSSDEAENRGSYRPMIPLGQGLVQIGNPDTDPAAVADIVAAALPGGRAVTVSGVQESFEDGGYRMVSMSASANESLLDGYGGVLGSSVLVSDGALSRQLTGLSAADADRAGAVLAEGGVVALTSRDVDADTVVVTVEDVDAEGNPVGKPRTVEAPALFVRAESGYSGPQGVLSPEVAKRLKVEPVPVGVLVTGAAITRTAEKDVEEALNAQGEGTSFYVERGYQTDQETLVVQLVLAGLGAVLMLGGTLTATFLALSDARPDLATLAAVGAAPRTRRGVAASYALVIGMVGAVLGALVGFVPGIAVTYPLTSNGWSPDGVSHHYLDVPWLMIIGVVLALPLVTAGLVGALARSRLPLVARLD